MKQKNGAEAAELTTEETEADSKTASAAKAAKGGAKTRSRTAPKAKSMKSKAGKFDFVGKVESLVVRGGAGTEVFEFGLRNRDGSRKSFRLRTSDSLSLSLMAPMVLAAHAMEAKIGVRAAIDENGSHYVTEIASRPKLGKA